MIRPEAQETREEVSVSKPDRAPLGAGVLGFQTLAQFS